MVNQDNPNLPKQLTPQALRALEEARLRRGEDGDGDGVLEIERDGPSGKEPTRFGDWERKGIAYDF
jgi:hypothetical protein